MALDCNDYPSSGFDVTAAVEARSFWCRTRNRVLGQVFKRFTDRTRPLDVLEVGCGIGGVIGSLRQLPNLRLTGSEIYIHGLRYAKSRLPDVEFIQLDATNIPFREAFDVIGAFDVLEHIPDDERAMSEVAKTVRPGGLFIVTVPQYPWMWSRLDDLVHHKRRYTRRELVGKLEKAGFEVRYVTSFVSVLFPAMVAQRLYERVRGAGTDAAAEFCAHVSPPAVVNTLFDWLMRIDEAALRLGFTLPFGGSLLAVAQRPGGGSSAR
ncbi:MAG TPA: class I SAM-dependent methyltransferase [Vicinamibacterales bacterium]|nr:class I SAM-dependent methyltransferase [Vicinamibacterales bacterium]